MDSPTDLRESFAFPLPGSVIGALLGVPDDELATFRTWSDKLITLADFEAAGAGEVYGQLMGYFSDLVDRKRRAPTEDVLSDLIAVRDEDTGRLSQHELEMMGLILLLAGYLGTANALSIGTIKLIEDGRLALLRDHPDKVPAAVEEVLRFQSGAAELPRYAAADLEIAGTAIQAGDMIVPSLQAANHDPGQFADPGSFDLDRTGRQHLAFGHGIHHCLGAALARMQLQVAFTALSTRLPGLQLAVDLGDLRWRTNMFGDRLLEALPVRW
ncbi:cytochrome P450 [Fodinicola feengrottensis]|nr:cytochrome P450 [Fodinicola feengrottensis]